MFIYTKQIEEIEQLHKAYLDLRENTPEFQRDGEECKAYHAWYDAAYVFFSSVEVLRESKDYSIFKANASSGLEITTTSSVNNNEEQQGTLD